MTRNLTVTNRNHKNSIQNTMYGLLLYKRCMADCGVIHSAVRSSRWPWQNPPLHNKSKISQQIPVQLQRALNSCVATHAADLLTRPVPWVLLFFLWLLFFYSPFFQLNCYSWGERVICDISAHRLIFAPPPPLPDRVYINRAATRKEWWETIANWQFYNSFTHLFFN